MESSVSAYRSPAVDAAGVDCRGFRGRVSGALRRKRAIRDTGPEARRCVGHATNKRRRVTIRKSNGSTTWRANTIDERVHVAVPTSRYVTNERHSTTSRATTRESRHGGAGGPDGFRAEYVRAHRYFGDTCHATMTVRGSLHLNDDVDSRLEVFANCGERPLGRCLEHHRFDSS